MNCPRPIATFVHAEPISMTFCQIIAVKAVNTGYPMVLFELLSPHGGWIAASYTLAGGIPSAVSGMSTIASAHPSRKSLAGGWVVIRTLAVMYLAERLVYFSRPELVAPYSGALGLLLVVWTLAAASVTADVILIPSGDKKTNSLTALPALGLAVIWLSTP